LSEYLHATTAALAAQAFRGVGNILQLIEHKARNEKRTRQKAGAGDIGNTAINNNAGI
jgi:hypothetical protein